MSPSRISPGEVLADRYRLVDLLADVDGARFWRATDSVLSRDVAVHAVGSEDERAAGMLEAARISATVTDPHLLRVLDCAEDPAGISWVVHEWGDGVSLDILLQQGPLPAGRAAWLVREVAEAVAHGHAQGVAHGRLNPEAVMVTHAGPVKLVGYAVDRALIRHRDPHPYHGDLDPFAADVIDLGGLLYAALTGRWAGVSPSLVESAPTDHDRPLRPRQVRAGVPRALDAICERVLHGDGSRHEVSISTAVEVAAALADYVGDPAAMAPPDVSSMYAEPPAAPARDADDETGEDTHAARFLGGGGEEAPTQASAPPTGAVPVVAAAAPPVWEQVPVPPPYVDSPERPLFSESERRVPEPPPAAPATPVPSAAPGRSPKRRAGRRARPAVAAEIGPVEERWAENGGPGRHAAANTSGDALDDSGTAWPFIGTEEDPPRARGTEGKGWLRVAAIVAMVIVLGIVSVVAWHRGQPESSAPSGASLGQAPGGGSDGPLAVTEVQDFDPEGGDTTENPDDVAFAVDGDPETTWYTKTYYSPALGGLKSGVGLLLDLGSVEAPREVEVRLVGTGTSMELLASPPDEVDPPTAVTGLKKIASSQAAGEEVTLAIPAGTRTRFLVLWLTELPPVAGGYRGEIADLTVRS